MSEFRFNHAELNRIARERWGVRYPIKLQRRWRRRDRRTGLYTVARNRNGRHTPWRRWSNGRPVEYWHEIQLTNHPDMEHMLRTLAHELEHARMTEALGYDTHDLLYSGFTAAVRRLGWRRRPPPERRSADAFEAVAERATERWAELLPCVTQREESK